jgi:protein-L-isoaspartate(D-aspartate) O-methyltransferase
MDTQEFKYKPKREDLVRLLRQKGITDERVLQAFLDVRRHLFMDSAFWDVAYDDTAYPIGYGQTISQPYTVAFMSALVSDGGKRTSGKVLEIGTGSGYQAAILAALGFTVFSIERLPEIYNRTKKLLETLKIRVNTRLGDGTLGWEEFAPYEAIVVTAGSPDIPQSLLHQLNPNGGRLIIPVGNSSRQSMKILRRDGETIYESSVDNFKFVPLIGKEGWQK